ncbi:MAG: YitT family protein [Clostridia bacterium]|nr:YitT family protein [Clostridia bacterium]
MVKRVLKDYLLITVGGVLSALGIYFFMIPSHIAVGTGTSLAMILSEVIPLPLSLISLLLNILLLLIGFLLIGPEFGAKTVYVSVLIPVVLGLMELLLPNLQSLTGDALTDLVCYVIVLGAAMALLFSRNASSGGLDIVAKIISKYTNMKLGSAVALAGVLVVLSSILVYDVKTVILGLLGTYFSGIAVDHFIFGLGIKRKVCVLSARHEEIVDFILHDLHSGASLYEVTGAYDGTRRTEIVTLVDKHEYRRLMEYIKEKDPKALVTVYSINELRYQPKVIPAEKKTK